MGPPQQTGVLPPPETPKHVLHLFEKSRRISQHSPDARIEEINPSSRHFLLPLCRRLRRIFTYPYYPVKLGGTKRNQLFPRQHRIKEFSVFLRLDNNVIHIVIRRALCLSLRHASRRGVIGNIHQAIRILFQLRGIKPWIYACDIVGIVIRRVYKYGVRLPVFKGIIIIIHHRHIGRQLTPFIMVCPH